MKVVLVHGAWQGAWVWQSVRDAWATPGVDLVAIDLPSTCGSGDMVTDAAAVAAFARDQSDDVCLLGHSYGGIVVTQAAAAVPCLRAVIYLAAIRPSLGQSTEAIRRGPKTELDSAIAVTGDVLTLNPERAAVALFNQPLGKLSGDPFGRTHPQPIATLRQPITRDVPTAVPTGYIVCSFDHSISPIVQRQMAGACTVVTEIPCSHMPQIDAGPQLASEISAILSRLLVPTS